MGGPPGRACTRIPNLVLAADYVRTHTDLATMEGANEAARRAVNAILDAIRLDGARRCEVWPLREPPALRPARALRSATAGGSSPIRAPVADPLRLGPTYRLAGALRDARFLRFGRAAYGRR